MWESHRLFEQYEQQQPINHSCIRMVEANGVGPHAQPRRIGGRSMTVLYGTETGNSEEIARELGQMAERLHFRTVVDEMNSFSLKDLVNSTVVVFVLSTTGQGDIPGNAADLWKNLLRKKLRPGCLNSVKFTIFGLGDSSYPRFNWAARKLHRRLTQLGASEFFASGEGDERHDDGIDSIYLPWNQGLRAALLADYPLPESIDLIPEDVQLPPRTLLRPVDQQAAQTIQEDVVNSGDPALPPPVLLPIPGSRIARVTQNSRVTPPDHWQDVRELIFSVESGGDSIGVGPGSTLVVYPKNFPGDVQTLVEMMGWNEVADRPMQLVPSGGPSDVSASDLPSKPHPKAASGVYANQGATLRGLLTHNLDITAVPKRTFLKELIYYASDELERERLVELTLPGNTDDFYDYTFRPGRTILEVLSDFPSVKIPFDRIIDCFPVIRGREFSIANGTEGLKRDGGSISTKINVHVLASLVEYRTIIRKPRQGLCSRYLKSLQEGTLITVKIKHNANTLLADSELDKRPLIAIATGTGIAPIKHLLDDRYARTPAGLRGEALLFFGCRNERADFYYRDYWKSLDRLEVIPAFSRDSAPVPLAIASDDQAPDYDYGKNYVQHQIRNQARRVAELIGNDALICLCGNSGRMPKSVREALLDAMVLGGLVERREDAETIFQRLHFWQETW